MHSVITVPTFLLLTLPLATSTGFYNDRFNSTLPTQCLTVCNPIQNLTSLCWNAYRTNFTEYNSCICDAEGASTQIPVCEACVRANDDDDDNNDNDNDNEYDDDDKAERKYSSLLSRCTFSSTSYNPSQTTNVLSVPTTLPASATTGTASVLPTESLIPLGTAAQQTGGVGKTGSGLGMVGVVVWVLGMM